MSALADLPLDGNRKQAAPLSNAEIADMKRLLASWEVKVELQVPQLWRIFRFDDFTTAMQFANTVAVLADAADHHPALLVEWGKVTLTWWTHSIKGLHLNDFIMAARCDVAYSNLPPVTPIPVNAPQ